MAGLPTVGHGFGCTPSVDRAHSCIAGASIVLDKGDGDASDKLIVSHPHRLRHQTFTWLDAQIQLISGHSSNKSLEVYQHLSLAQVEAEYQRAVKHIDI